MYSVACTCTYICICHELFCFTIFQDKDFEFAEENALDVVKDAPIVDSTFLDDEDYQNEDPGSGPDELPSDGPATFSGSTPLFTNGYTEGPIYTTIDSNNPGIETGGHEWETFHDFSLHPSVTEFCIPIRRVHTEKSGLFGGEQKVHSFIACSLPVVGACSDSTEAALFLQVFPKSELPVLPRIKQVKSHTIPVCTFIPE